MKTSPHSILSLINALIGVLVSLLLLIFLIVGIIWVQYSTKRPHPLVTQSGVPPLSLDKTDNESPESTEALWIAPDWATVDQDPQANLIKYGRELISNTSEYLGPTGKVKKIANGMNCQNCHLQAGTVPFGNNFGAVTATYPKIRNRSGQSEGIPQRINDCFERSLNGSPLALESEEMLAMVAYMQWLGNDVPKGTSPEGSGLVPLPLLDRAADPIKGKAIYTLKCESCHREKGEGMMNPGQTAYIYPPLWGSDSYNEGAGLFRISRFAGYVKANMPLGATFEKPMLSYEEAWDLAAYVNSMERPKMDLSKDWPDPSKKPMDHPFGPFADEYSEEQHKYGPFQPILAAKSENK